MPICTKCHASRPAAEFKPDRRTKTGLAKVCNPCKTPTRIAFGWFYTEKR